MTDAVLTLTGVTFRRGGKQILHGIDLVAHRGEHWALLGPNGAGKSTILAFCGAQAHPTTGAVDVLEHRLGRVDMQELRRHIGHVNPRHGLRSPLTAREVALTGFTGTVERAMRWEPSADQIARADALLGLVGLADRPDIVWPTMSQGERGRVLDAGIIDAVVTSESISEAFRHPIDVTRDGGRWSARARRVSRVL